MNRKDYSLTTTCEDGGFSLAMAALLESFDGESYIPLFKKFNIGISDLSEMSDNDLIVMGVGDSTVREKILETLDYLPKQTQINMNRAESMQLSPNDISIMLSNSGKHINRLILSVISSRISMIKCMKIDDFLVSKSPPFYASDIMLKAIDETEILISKMENKLKNLNKCSNEYKRKKLRRKKIITSIIGGATIVALSIALMKSIDGL